MIGSTLAFSRLAETDGAKADAAARSSVRLVVEEAPVKRDAGFTTSFAPMIKKVSPAVVKVFTTSAPKQQQYQNNPFFDDPFFRRFFGDDFRGQQVADDPQEVQFGIVEQVHLADDGARFSPVYVYDPQEERDGRA